MYLWLCNFINCFVFSWPQYLADIEEHLGVTIPSVDSSFDVPVDEFEGKVTYGEKRKANGGSVYDGHIEQLAPSVAELASMEHLAQTAFLKMRSSKRHW